jgi:arylsulfatase A-like enzyme
MNVVSIVVDRWQARYAGPYGNTWMETPHLNRMAVQGFLFDHAVIDTPELTEACTSLWTGVHAARRRGQESRELALPARLAAAGVETWLVTDDPDVLRHPRSIEFSQRRLVQPQPPALADEHSGTAVGRFFIESVPCLERVRPPFLLWLHVSALGQAWDSPLGIRRRHVEEEDPDPPLLVEVPHLTLDPHPDPDLLLGFRRVYGAQVELLDECLAAFCQALEESGQAADTAVLIAGARGMPLGEHGRVGPHDAPLYGELVHVPFLLRLPNGEGAAGRSPALVQPMDVAPTIAELLGVDWPARPGDGASLLTIVREQQEAVRDRALVVAPGGERAIRTESWYLRQSVSELMTRSGAVFESGPIDAHSGGIPAKPEEAAEAELFLKPDDRWEVNDVARRLPEVTACLKDVLAELETTLTTGTGQASPLPEPLLHTWG